MCVNLGVSTNIVSMNAKGAKGEVQLVSKSICAVVNQECGIMKSIFRIVITI